MKVRKKQNNTKISDMLSDFDDRAKGCFLKEEEFGDLSDHILNGRDVALKEENFNTVDQLDIMDISVSNFQFSTFNKIEFEGLDIINEDDFMEKDELFNTGLMGNGNKNLEEISSFEGVALSLPKDTEDSSSNTHKDANENVDETAQTLSKRAQKRKKQLEESKPQCPVRTTARHFTKMFDYFEANPGLATGQLPKIIYRKKWRELTDILNQQGIGEKTTEKWQKTWSDYKLHLRKKLSGIKRSGKALDVPNQFTDQDRRALTNMGVSLCDEISIKKRFNPDSIESEDSSSHSATIQAVVQAVNIPPPIIQNSNISSTPQGSNSSPTGTKKAPKLIKQQNRRKLTERRKKLQKLRRFRTKTMEYQKKSLTELRSLRLILNSGLNRIGDVLERLAKNSESNTAVAKNLAETAAQIATTATNFAEMITGYNTKHSNTHR